MSGSSLLPGGRDSRARARTSQVFGGSNAPWNPRGKYALFALGAVAAIAFSMVWNPPTATVHAFSEASDFNAEKDSGCVNSGAGCHGDETAYKDFNAYHPNAKCTTCHEYQGVGCIPCHAPREHECALCHDGSMERAPDRVRLSDPFPRGHYRETTHTVTPSSMQREVFSAKGGQAKAACSACHEGDLATSHRTVPVVDGSSYGPTIGCGECHNDVRSFGQAEVLADWRARTCEACHKVGASAPMHAERIADPVESESRFGCADTGAGCHAATDLHALHPDAPKDCSGSAASGEPGCHDLEVEAHIPVARSCGGDGDESCHRSSDRSGYLHKNARGAHSPTTGRPAADTSVSGTPCGACHYMAPGGESLIAEHALPTSAGSAEGAEGCTNCHAHKASADALADKWSDRESASSCSTCHDGVLLGAQHGDGRGGRHVVATGSEGCADTGAGCHPGHDLSAVGNGPAAVHRDCLRCHDKDHRDGNRSYDPTARTCGAGRDCHDEPRFDPRAGSHATKARAQQRDAAHTARALVDGSRLADAASGTATPCTACHAAGLVSEHARPSNVLAAADTCTGCHNANQSIAGVVKDGWATRDSSAPCTACHDGSAAARVHESIETSHVATEKTPDGVVTPERCSRVGCHGTADVRIVHADKGCAQAVCHSATGSPVATGVLTCGGAEGDAKACHTGTAVHRDFAGSHIATEVSREGVAGPGGCVRPGCHATADVTVLHKETPLGCYQAPCHGADGPALMTCGGGDPATACHSGSSKHQEFATKHKATELGRDGAASPGGCAKPGCHASTDVTVVHDHTCTLAGCHVEGGPAGIMSCGGKDAALGCHVTRHAERTVRHKAVERDTTGAVSPGFCARSGCHTSVDAMTVHEHSCYISGCHVEGGPTVQTCGGSEGQTDACHVGFSETRHDQSHDASLSGTVAGVTYGIAENTGCLGECHDADLVAEHRLRLLGGGLEGSAGSVCAICHEVAGAGTYATSAAVESAVAAHDRRCIACHASVGDDDTGVSAPPSTCVAAAPAAALSVEAASTVSAVAASTLDEETSAAPRVDPRTPSRFDRIRRALRLRWRRADGSHSEEASRATDSNAPPDEPPPGAAPPGAVPDVEPPTASLAPARFHTRHARSHRRDPR